MVWSAYPNDMSWFKPDGLFSKHLLIKHYIKILLLTCILYFKPRFSDVTCGISTTDNGDANCNGTNCDGTDDRGGTITQSPLLGGFYFFITFTLLVVLADV